MGLTAPEPHSAHPVETDLEPLIRQIDEIGRAFETSGTYEVILYNDEVHAMDDVVQVVQYATRCTLREAFEITQCAHEAGQAIAFAGSRRECERVAAIFRKVELGCEIR